LPFGTEEKRLMRDRTVKVMFGVALLASFVAGCASGGGASPVRSTQERVTFDLGAGAFDMKLFRDEVLSADTLALAPAVAWQGLVRAYASLGVPLQGANAGRRVIATQRFRGFRNFAGERLSRWLDCGSSMTGDIATTYEVTMRLATMVDTSLAARSVLLTSFTATAVATGSGTTPVHCRSLGKLEKQLAQMAREKSIQ
jgi:hypothetical protein